MKKTKLYTAFFSLLLIPTFSFGTTTILDIAFASLLGGIVGIVKVNRA